MSDDDIQVNVIEPGNTSEDSDSLILLAVIKKFNHFKENQQSTVERRKGSSQTNQKSTLKPIMENSMNAIQESKSVPTKQSKPSRIKEITSTLKQVFKPSSSKIRQSDQKEKIDSASLRIQSIKSNSVVSIEKKTFQTAQKGNVGQLNILNSARSKSMETIERKTLKPTRSFRSAQKENLRPTQSRDQRINRSNSVTSMEQKILKPQQLFRSVQKENVSRTPNLSTRSNSMTSIERNTLRSARLIDSKALTPRSNSFSPTDKKLLKPKQLFRSENTNVQQSASEQLAPVESELLTKENLEKSKRTDQKLKATRSFRLPRNKPVTETESNATLLRREKTCMSFRKTVSSHRTDLRRETILRSAQQKKEQWECGLKFFSHLTKDFPIFVASPEERESLGMQTRNDEAISSITKKVQEQCLLLYEN